MKILTEKEFVEMSLNEVIALYPETDIDTLVRGLVQYVLFEDWYEHYIFWCRSKSKLAKALA